MESIKNYDGFRPGDRVRHASKEKVPRFTGTVVSIREPHRKPLRYQVDWEAAHGYPARIMHHYEFELAPLGQEGEK